MNNLSVRLVFDRKHVATKKHQASVQLEVTYERKRKFISTGIKLYSDQWSKDQKVKNHPQSSLYNKQLNDMVANIYNFAHQLTSQHQDVTLEKIGRCFDANSNHDTCSLIDWMRKRIMERPIAESTRKKQLCILRALVKFGKIKSFSDICLGNILEWDKYAKTRCTSKSSVYDFHKVLKIYVREAYAYQLISTDPYQTIKLDHGTSEGRRFLTKEELKLLEDRELQDRSLERVRDMFLFCCYTGLSYADLSKFDFNEAFYSDGMYRIRDRRKKTGTEYNISIIDKAMNILKKYDYRLPVISNQKYNAFLKLIGAFCGIKKRLTSHVARHTFATTVTLGNGVRIEVVSKMLGHTNIQTTQIYAKIFQQEVDKEFNRLNGIV